MTDLAPIAPKIGRLVRMLDSESDGEALASARALGRVLRGAGATMHDLADLIERPALPNVSAFRWPAASAPEAGTQPRWDAIGMVDRNRWLDAARAASDVLDGWQLRFVGGITANQFLTAKQLAAIDSIFARMWAKGLRV